MQFTFSTVRVPTKAPPPERVMPRRHSVEEMAASRFPALIYFAARVDHVYNVTAVQHAKLIRTAFHRLKYTVKPSAFANECKVGEPPLLGNNSCDVEIYPRFFFEVIVTREI